jgi:hypothetical protein
LISRTKDGLQSNRSEWIPSDPAGPANQKLSARWHFAEYPRGTAENRAYLNL